MHNRRKKGPLRACALVVSAVSDGESLVGLTWDQGTRPGLTGSTTHHHHCVSPGSAWSVGIRHCLSFCGGRPGLWE